MTEQGKLNLQWGASYQSCVDACISIALDDGAEADAAIYRELPVPSEEEWAECIQEVADEPSEDLGNPYHCMGRYELLLHKRGVRTVLDSATNQVEKELQALALLAGIPNELVPEAIRLDLLAREDTFSADPRDKKQDN